MSNSAQSIDDEWDMFINEPSYEHRILQPLKADTRIATVATKSTAKSTKGVTSGTDATPNAVEDELETISPTAPISSHLVCPKASSIYISTMSKIAYLKEPLDLGDVFWKLHIMRYDTLENGIVKKQMKFNSSSHEEVEALEAHMKDEFYVVNQIMTRVGKPSGKKNWFKDVRKISVGLSMKDVISYRVKRKCAFYNCFVIIIRIKIDDETDSDHGNFREFHVKIFNTGKIEIPGIQTEYHLTTVLEHIVSYIRPIIGDHVCYVGGCDTVLINSNFNCGFYINRETLFAKLKTTYNIQCIYDPCSYPGIQCKFYYDATRAVQDGTRPQTDIVTRESGIVTISFMVFRTGRVLIVGMCVEEVLEVVYAFLKDLLRKEFPHICQRLATPEELAFVKKKNTKIRKRDIVFDDTLPTCSCTNMIETLMDT